MRGLPRGPHSCGSSGDRRRHPLSYHCLIGNLGVQRDRDAAAQPLSYAHVRRRHQDAGTGSVPMHLARNVRVS